MTSRKTKKALEDIFTNEKILELLPPGTMCGSVIWFGGATFIITEIQMRNLSSHTEMWVEVYAPNTNEKRLLRLFKNMAMKLIYSKIQ